MPGIKLPRGAFLLPLFGAMSRRPTGLPLFGSLVHQGKNEEGLAFDMYRDFAPPLFETLDGFRGNAQNLRHLVLCFSQVMPYCHELFLLHCKPLPGFARMSSDAGKLSGQDPI